MAEQVTGHIGDSPVELNNAATESTLKQILSYAQVDSKNLFELAKASGVKTDALRSFNEAVAQTTVDQKKTTDAQVNYRTQLTNQIDSYKKISSVIDQLDSSIKALMDGTETVSGIFGRLKDLPAGLGTLASVLQRVASIQEENFAAYQKITTVGANLSGSLTDLRLAAANSYMTLNAFADLIKNNSKELVTLGGTANSGALAFAKFSNNILSSNFGTQITAMGYTFDSANQSMLNFLGLMGVRSSKELSSSNMLQESTKAYLDQLDRLANLTGESREAQEENMKKQRNEADIQITLARMDVKERAAFNASLSFMTTKYGDVGRDLVVAQAQGRVAITQGAGLLTSFTPRLRDVIANMEKAGNQYGIGSKEYIAAQNQVTIAMQQGINRIPTAMFSVVEDFKSFGKVTNTVAQEQLAGQTSIAELTRIEQDRQDRISKIQKSQAEDMANAMKGIRELGQSLWTAFTPLIGAFTPIISLVGDLAHKLADVIKEYPKFTAGLAVLGTVMAGFIAYRTQQLIRENLKGTRLNPMWVHDDRIEMPGLDVEGGGGKGDKGKPTKGTSKSPGRFGGMGKSLVKAGVLEGVALAVSTGGQYAKEHGHEKVGAGMELAGSGFSGYGWGALLGAGIATLASPFTGGMSLAALPAIFGAAGAGIGMYSNRGVLGAGSNPDLGSSAAKVEEDRAKMQEEEAKRRKEEKDRLLSEENKRYEAQLALLSHFEEQRELYKQHLIALRAISNNTDSWTNTNPFNRPAR